jgi:hypothetical protein
MARFLARALPCAAAFALLVVIGQGCSVDQIALQGCRDIEDARCEVAQPCANLSVPDPEACKRFYRDQCLHGMEIAADPGQPTVDKCVSAIRAAGACASSGHASDVGGCEVATTSPTSACGIIANPELATDCAWLIPPAPAPTVTDAGVDADATDDVTTD